MPLENIFVLDVDLKEANYFYERKVTANDSITFVVNLTNDGLPIDLSGVTAVSLVNTRLDQTTIVTPGTKTGANQATFNLGQNETKIPGRVTAIVQLYDANGRLSTLSFNYTVIKDPTGDGYIPPGSDKTLIQVVLGDGPLVIQQAQDAVDYMNEQGDYALEQGNYAKTQGDYAKNQGDYAKTQGTSAQTAASNANVAKDNAVIQTDYAKTQGDYAKTQGDYAKSKATELESRVAASIATTTNSAEIIEARTGADNVARASLGTLVREIHQDQLSANTKTETITHGMWILNTLKDISSPMKVEFYGQTLVNRISNFNRWSLHSEATIIDEKTIELNATANYKNSSIEINVSVNEYILISALLGGYVSSSVAPFIQYEFKDAGNTVISNNYKYATTNNQVVYMKAIVPSNAVKLKVILTQQGIGKFTFKEPRLFTISADTYNKIGVSLTDADVERMFPYCDSVQHVSNPIVTVEGANLLNSFVNYQADRMAFNSPYNMTLISNYPASELKLAKNTDFFYSQSSESTARFSVVGVNSSGSPTTITAYSTIGKIFNSGNYEKIQIFYDGGVGATVIEPMLNLGTTAKPFVPRNPSYLYAETTLAGNDNKKDILSYNEDKRRWEKTKWWMTDVVLDGSLSWVFHTNATGYKRARIENFLNFNGNIQPYKLVKYNGNVKDSSSDYNNGDGAYVGNTNTFLHIAIPNTDSGWLDSMATVPNDLIKSYFYGWFYRGDGTTHKWRPIGDTDDTRLTATLPTSPAPTIAEGKIDYYKLTYQLATPVIEEVKVDGDLVVNGATQVTVGSEFTYTEDSQGKRTYTITPTAQRTGANLTEVKVTYEQSLKSTVNNMVTKVSDISTSLGDTKRFAEKNQATITDIVDDLYGQLKQKTETITHGMWILNTLKDIASSMKVEFVGNTLVNLLGEIGNIENLNNINVIKATASIDSTNTLYGSGSLKLVADTTSGEHYTDLVNNTRLKLGKCYIASVRIKGYGAIRPIVKDTLGNVISTTVGSKTSSNSFSLSYIKLNPTQDVDVQLRAHITSSSGSLSYTANGEVINVDGFSIYEIPQSTFDKIGVSLLDADVERMFPYVSGVAHVKNPVLLAEGSNLLPPFTEWTLHANAKVISPYELELNATTSYQGSWYSFVPVPNQSYTFTVDHNARLEISEYNSTNTELKVHYTASSSIKTLTFTTQPTTVKIVVRVTNTVAGTFTFKQPMLNVGSTSKPFVPRNNSYLYAECTLAGNSDKKDILYKNEDKNRWEKTKWFEINKVIDGTLAYAFHSDYTGFKAIVASASNFPNIFGQQVNQLLQKYDGKVILNGTYTTNADVSDVISDGRVIISIADIDSGWKETQTPTANMIKGLANGWKYTGDGVSAHSWVSVLDGTTTPTEQTETFVAANKVNADWKGFWQLTYQLATPVIEPVTVEGDLVVNGATQVTVGSEFTYTEDDEGKRTYTITPTAQRTGANLTEVKVTYDQSPRSALDSVIVKQSDLATDQSILKRQMLEVLVRLEALEGV